MKLNLHTDAQVQCPECEYGAMKTPRDHARNCCDFCWMTKHDGLAIEREIHKFKINDFNNRGTK